MQSAEFQRVVIVDVAGSAGAWGEGESVACQSERKPVGARGRKEAESQPLVGMAKSRNSSPQKQASMSSGPGVVVCCHLVKWHPEFPPLRRRNRQSVIVVDMARSAGHVGVPVGQQEARRVVIEDRPWVQENRVCGTSSSSPPQNGAPRPSGAPGWWSAATSSNGSPSSRNPSAQFVKVIIVVDMAGSAGHVWRARWSAGSPSCCDRRSPWSKK